MILKLLHLNNYFINPISYRSREPWVYPWMNIDAVS